MQDELLIHWKRLRYEAQILWQHCTPDEFDAVDGRRENLVRLLEQRYGFARKHAEREIDTLIAEFEDRLRKAA